jgi:hypothetical protein
MKKKYLNSLVLLIIFCCIGGQTLHSMVSPQARQSLSTIAKVEAQSRVRHHYPATPNPYRRYSTKEEQTQVLAKKPVPSSTSMHMSTMSNRLKIYAQTGLNAFVGTTLKPLYRSLLSTSSAQNLIDKDMSELHGQLDGYLANLERIPNAQNKRATDALVMQLLRYPDIGKNEFMHTLTSNASGLLGREFALDKCIDRLLEQADIEGPITYKLIDTLPTLIPHGIRVMNALHKQGAIANIQGKQHAQLVLLLLTQAINKTYAKPADIFAFYSLADTLFKVYNVDMLHQEVHLGNAEIQLMHKLKTGIQDLQYHLRNMGNLTLATPFATVEATYNKNKDNAQIAEEYPLILKLLQKRIDTIVPKREPENPPNIFKRVFNYLKNRFAIEE